MRIGISTSVIQRGKTGIAQHLFGLLRALDEEAPDEWSFVLFVLEDDLPLFSPLRDRFARISVAEEFRPAVRNIRWHQTVLPRLAREHRLDAVHIPSYRRLLWNAPCPRVATIHDLAPFRVAGKYDWARMFYGRVIVKYLARRQEAIIAVSENTARDLATFFGIGRERVRVIYNGLDHARFFRRNGEVNASTVRRFPLERPFLLYVARLEHPGKNHLRLIEAFEKFKEQTGSNWLLAFGGSDWNGAEVIHERIAKSRYRQEIRSLGFVSDEELPHLYSAAEAFVYPSLYEGFGMPPLEAMACGCPVVCSNRGSLGEVVGDAARIIDPEDCKSIALALMEMGRDSEARSRWIKLGVTRAAAFSWERAARETLEVYSGVARRGLPPVK